MRRLYIEIYVTLVAVLVLFVVVIGLLWWAAPPSPHQQDILDGVGRLVHDYLPDEGASARSKLQALERAAGTLDMDLALWESGRLVAATGEPLPEPDPAWREGQYLGFRRGRWLLALRLSEGRWLMARHHAPRRPHAFVWLAAGLAVAVMIGAYPLSRRITGRLERLREAADRLGAPRLDGSPSASDGGLSEIVPVEGNDEVAELARAFNQASLRITELVRSQRNVLASASHELRSPLARLRVLVESIKDEAPDAYQAAVEEITVLDELIDELLIASKLDTLRSIERHDEVDLLGLVGEESARYEGNFRLSGSPSLMRGDERLLRRLAGNLIGNAVRHGGPSSPVDIAVEPVEPCWVRLTVRDRGPGVPEVDRERVFWPFYRVAGRTEGGVGLGLSIVRQIAERHGGRVEVQEATGGGALFLVLLDRGQVS